MTDKTGDVEIRTQPRHVSDWRAAIAAENKRLGIKDTPRPRPKEEDPEPIRIDPARATKERHVSGVMNKLETSYSHHLELRKLTGEIRAWKFEPLKFRLAPQTSYSIDFMVQLADGSIEMHETKGFWRDDARVKIKMAAALFPEFQFTAVQWIKKEGWKFEMFRRG